jgi:tetrahydromethanopterin S-methyltransferase subunit E
MMNFLTVVLIGAVLGALDGVGIFFEPREPYKWQILCAATLKGALVALLTGFSLGPTTRWWSAMITGALYGLAFSLVIYLAKGGPTSGDAPYVIPSGIITGGLIGLLIVMWAIKTI